MHPSASTPKIGVMSRGFLQAYLITMRPYLMFVSGITGIIGLSLAPGVGPFRSGLIALASFLSYGFGQALTDCFQIDTDRISAPYRPLTRGVIGTDQVLGVSLMGLALCVAAFAAANPSNLLLGGIASVGLATYTAFKRRWWGGPWYNAWIVALLFLMAYLAGSGRPDVPLPPALPWVLATVFLGYANFVLAGYFKDTAADARSGYNTLPVVFGRTVGSRVSDALAAMALLALLAAKLSASFRADLSVPNLLSWGLILAAVGTSLRAQVLLHAVTRDEAAYPAIGLVAHSYLLGLSGLGVAARPDWGLPLLGFYVLFLLTLRARPSRSQI